MNRVGHWWPICISERGTTLLDVWAGQGFQNSCVIEGACEGISWKQLLHLFHSLLCFSAGSYMSPGWAQNCHETQGRVCCDFAKACYPQTEQIWRKQKKRKLGAEPFRAFRLITCSISRSIRPPLNRSFSYGESNETQTQHKGKGFMIWREKGWFLRGSHSCKALSPVFLPFCLSHLLHSSISKESYLPFTSEKLSFLLISR